MKRSSGDIVRGIVRVLAILVILVSGFFLVRQLWDYYNASSTYTGLQQQYTQPAQTAAPQQEEQTPALVVDFESLLAQNEDVVAWIDFDNMDLSYPILHGETNDTYLRHLLDGSYATAGSLFLECANQSIQDQYAIVYGHNMRDGSMFHQLGNYRDPEFYAQDGGWFTLYLPDGQSLRYQIFGYTEVASDDPIYTVGYAEGRNYTQFLKSLCEKRLYETGVAVYSTDQVLALSTCTDDGNRRQVVFARRAQVDKVQ